MIIDTSAVVAVILNEPTTPAVIDVIERSVHLRMSAASVVELTAVGTRWKRPEAHGFLEQLLELWGVEIIPFDVDQSKIAQRAYRDFGRGSGHRAGLNLGDCYSYALAKHRSEPLLFVGDDFGHTDVRCALEPPAR